MYSLINALSTLTGLADQALGIALAHREHKSPIAEHEIAEWRRRELPRPVWVQRAAARWMAELWRAERATCPLDQRSTVDARYAAALDPALGEVYGLLDRLRHAVGPLPPEDLRVALQPLAKILAERLRRKLDIDIAEIIGSSA